MMLRGNIGRAGRGACAQMRGHSNVRQGNRTVGIEEQPTGAFLDKLGAAFGFNPPREHGYDVAESIEAMLRGDVRVFIASWAGILHRLQLRYRAHLGRPARLRT